MKKIISLIAILSSVLTTGAYSQNKSGLLFGAGVGFESTALDPNSKYIAHKIYSYFNYKYNGYLGYRFRFETKDQGKLFFDIDPMLKLQVINIEDLSYFSAKDNQTIPYSSNPYLFFNVAEKNTVNLQFSVASSLNYKLTDKLYAGIGVEPTWNIVTEQGKRFDVSAIGRVGYDFKVLELALTYRHGFINVMDKYRFDKARTSDLNISVFIPLRIK